MRANRCKPGSKIVLQARGTETGLRIPIIDQGVGIARHLEKELYTPFTSSKASGMGLGLSISRSIVAAHGSQIEFSNNKAGGATFSFSLSQP